MVALKATQRRKSHAPLAITRFKDLREPERPMSQADGQQR